MAVSRLVRHTPGRLVVQTPASCGKGRARIVISKGVPKTMMEGTAQQKVAQTT